jgi:hypothetical protein
VRLGEHAEVP